MSRFGTNEGLLGVAVEFLGTYGDRLLTYGGAAALGMTALFGVAVLGKRREDKRNEAVRHWEHIRDETRARRMQTKWLNQLIANTDSVTEPPQTRGNISSQSGFKQSASEHQVPHLLTTIWGPNSRVMGVEEIVAAARRQAALTPDDIQAMINGTNPQAIDSAGSRQPTPPTPVLTGAAA